MLRCTSSRAILVLAVLFASLRSGGGEAADPAGQAPVFPSQAEIVTVDVLVLDRDGKPVPGLNRPDFVVKEDGRPQTVTAFEAVEAVLPAVVAPETATSISSVARVVTNVSAPPTRRTFAIVFDDLHVGDLNVEQAKCAVRAFLERDVRPGDRLVLLTTSDARYWSTTRGTGDAGFQRALDGVTSRRLARESLALQMSPVEALRIADLGDHYVADRVRRRGPSSRGFACGRARSASASSPSRAGV